MKRALAATVGLIATILQASAFGAEPGQNYEYLKGMDFMVGQWKAEGKAAEDDEPEMAGKSYVYRENCRWVVQKNAMVIDWELAVEGKVVSTGKALRGWDVKAAKVEHLEFGSDGGWGRATGTKQGDAWVFHFAGVLGEGREYSNTTTVRPVDKDTFSFRITDRVTGGKTFSDIDVVMKREKKPEK